MILAMLILGSDGAALFSRHFDCCTVMLNDEYTTLPTRQDALEFAAKIAGCATISDIEDYGFYAYGR